MQNSSELRVGLFSVGMIVTRLHNTIYAESTSGVAVWIVRRLKKPKQWHTLGNLLLHHESNHPEPVRPCPNCPV
jgi:hypothetical protein